MNCSLLLEKLTSYTSAQASPPHESGASLPEHDALLFLADEALTVLENEEGWYRSTQTVEGKNRAGGLVDFTSNPLPVVIIPDLHARTDFFLNVLKKNLEINGERKCILEFLMEEKLYLVFLGDLFHAESRQRNRWMKAWSEWIDGNFEGPAITEEMAENLALFQMVLTVKITCPSHFHYLKGNHENILNESGRGNHPFRKFADEGNQVYSFMSSHYGDAVLHVMSEFEHALPLVAVFSDCVISHAEPVRPFTREEIISYSSNPQVVLGLTWTANDEAQDGSVLETEKNLLGHTDGVLWFGGHRPVPGVYLTRQNGRFIQFHNPGEQNIALVLPGKPFDFTTGFINVENASNTINS